MAIDSGMIPRVIDTFDDKRNPADDGLQVKELEQFCWQVRQQPEWRTMADTAADYYDHNQTDQETAAALAARGMAPLQRNLVWSTTNLVLGIEAQNKRDWKVDSDSDDVMELAEGLSARLHQHERETRADRAISDAFASQVKTGIGWIEVTRNADPFAYPHKVAAVHRRELWWDWFARDPALNDSGFIIRRRWFPKAYLNALLPQMAGIFDAVMDNWGRLWLDNLDSRGDLLEAFNQAQRTTLSELEWLDRTQQRICIYEVRHQVWTRGYVLRIDGDRAVELNLKNPIHVIALNQGVKPEGAVYAKWRVSLWAGPYRISESADVPSKLPYIPLWGFREDLTGIPYGIIRGMISQQDEINARRQMMMWLLSSVMIEMDSDALDKTVNTVQDVMREISSPDAVVVLNPLRTNRGSGFKVIRNVELANQQFELMRDAEAGLQSVAGIFQDMLGKQGAATSGVAIGQLINQGTTGLAELFDNYSYARQLVGERLMDQDREMIKGKQTEVVIGETSKRRTIIVLNQPVQDEKTGVIVLKNDTESSRVKIALEDVPSTPTYRAQLMSSLGEIVKSLPPQLQAYLVPYYLEMSDLPNKKELADLLRKQLGIQEDVGGGEDPEVADLKAKLDQAMQIIQQLQNDPALKKTQADADKSRALADKARAETEQIKLETVDRLMGGDEGDQGAPNTQPQTEQAAA